MRVKLACGSTEANGRALTRSGRRTLLLAYAMVGPSACDADHGSPVV
jgi:hypothetical protein